MLGVAFRVDASSRIGTGHVMRCLTLANELRARGTRTRFICRAHFGHMADRIKRDAHEVVLLPYSGEARDCADTDEQAGYASWLGSDWKSDAQETAEAVAEFPLSWLVVDHYAIGAAWEQSLRAATGARIMAIDGQANRKHDCDLLLDPTLSPMGAARWQGLVPDSCLLFAGPQYALLRPEFIEARRILRQRDGNIKRIFIAFGGVDEPNATSAALAAVIGLGRPDIMVDVVVGEGNPHRARLQAACLRQPNVRLHVQPANVAELMQDADLAIGGGGTMLLEQCCLGLPSIVVSIADNQVNAARSLHDAGAVIYLGGFGAAAQDAVEAALLRLIGNKAELKRLQFAAGKLMAEPEMTVSQFLLGDT